MAEDKGAARAADEALQLAAQLGLPDPGPGALLPGRPAAAGGATSADSTTTQPRSRRRSSRDSAGSRYHPLRLGRGQGNLADPGPPFPIPRGPPPLAQPQGPRDVVLAPLRRSQGPHRAGDWDEALEQARELAPELEAAQNLAELGYLTAVEASLLAEKERSMRQGTSFLCSNRPRPAAASLCCEPSASPPLRSC